MASPKYICARCGFGTNTKHVLKTHIKKTSICEMNIADLDKDKLMESYVNLTQKITEFQCA